MFGQFARRPAMNATSKARAHWLYTRPALAYAAKPTVIEKLFSRDDQQLPQTLPRNNIAGQALSWKLLDRDGSLPRQKSNLNPNHPSRGSRRRLDRSSLGRLERSDYPAWTHGGVTAFYQVPALTIRSNLMRRYSEATRRYNTKLEAQPRPLTS